MTAGQRQLISLKEWAVEQALSDEMTPAEIGAVLGVEEREVEEAIAEHQQHIADCEGRT